MFRLYLIFLLVLNSQILIAIEYQVFLVAGQSNAVGWGSRNVLLDEVFPNYFLKQPQDYVQVYHILNETVEPLTIGLNHNSNVEWGADFHGPEVGFLQYLFDRDYISSEKPSLVFKYAWGGTNLAYDWSVDNPDSYYYKMIGHYENILEQLHFNGDTVNPKALLWVQGESDGGKKNQALC